MKSSLRNPIPELLAVASLVLALARVVIAEPVVPQSARVNGTLITPAEVDATRRAAMHEGQLPATGHVPALNRNVLQQLIDREIVLGALSKSGHRATPAAVDEALAKLRAQFAGDEQLFLRHLNQKHSTEQVLRGQLAWKLSWESYLKATLTDPVLETYFKAHQRDFDGTQLRVSQILLQVPKESSDSTAVDALKTKAEQIRAEITTAKSTFADAAKRYSTSAAREEGGDLGFIPRHDVMDEKFSQAAFALQKGETSLPLVSSFGVHLIQVTDVRPGAKKWSDVKRELRDAASRDLYDKILAAERPRAKIEYDVPSRPVGLPSAQPRP